MPKIWEWFARLNNSVLTNRTNDVVGCHSSHHASWQRYMLAWHSSITPQCQWKASGSFQSMSDVGMFADCWDHGIISIVCLHPPLLSIKVGIAVGLLTGLWLPPSTGLAICLWLLIDSTSRGDTIVPTAEGRGHWLRARQTWPSRKSPAARNCHVLLGTQGWGAGNC